MKGDIQLVPLPFWWQPAITVRSSKYALPSRSQCLGPNAVFIFHRPYLQQNKMSSRNFPGSHYQGKGILMSPGHWQTLGSGFNLLCKCRETKKFTYGLREQAKGCVCLCAKTRWGYLVIRNLSPSVGCGAFAQHHRHCLGKHRRALLRNPNSQRGSQHACTTAAGSSPPGGQSSEGRRCLQHVSCLQHKRCAQPTKYKQPSSPRSALLSFTLRLRIQKFWVSFWTMFLYSNFMLLFLHQRER